MSPKQIIFKLETKVEAAIELIRILKQKNAQLNTEKDQLQVKFKEFEDFTQQRLDEYEERVLELEKLVDSAQKEQSNLEKSVVSALSNFDSIEELQNDTHQVFSAHSPVATAAARTPEEKPIPIKEAAKKSNAHFNSANNARKAVTSTPPPAPKKVYDSTPIPPFIINSPPPVPKEEESARPENQHSKAAEIAALRDTGSKPGTTNSAPEAASGPASTFNDNSSNSTTVPADKGLGSLPLGSDEINHEENDNELFPSYDDDAHNTGSNSETDLSEMEEKINSPDEILVEELNNADTDEGDKFFEKKNIDIDDWDEDHFFDEEDADEEINLSNDFDFDQEEKKENDIEII